MDYAYLKPKGQLLPDPVLTKFRRRIFSQDDDVFLIVAGKRGGTKSGSSIRLGTSLDIDYKGNNRCILPKTYFPKGFSLKPGEVMPRVIYKPSHLLHMLKNNRKYPAGTCIIWDEVGVGGDARDFAKQKNKLLKRTFQTVRSLNWFIILTAVTLKDFDVGFGRNAGFYMEAKGKVNLTDGVKNYAYGKFKFKEIDINTTTGKRYYKYLRYSDDAKDKVLSGYYYVKKPHPRYENPYKRYKHLFQTKLYGDYSNEMDGIEEFEINEDMKSESDFIEDKIKEVINSPLDYYDVNKTKFILAAIQFTGIKIPIEAKAKKIIELLNFKLSKGDIVIDK